MEADLNGKQIGRQTVKQVFSGERTQEGCPPARSCALFGYLTTRSFHTFEHGTLFYSHQQTHFSSYSTREAGSACRPPACSHVMHFRFGEKDIKDLTKIKPFTLFESVPGLVIFLVGSFRPSGGCRNSMTDGLELLDPVCCDCCCVNGERHRACVRVGLSCY